MVKGNKYNTVGLILEKSAFLRNLQLIKILQKFI